MVVWHGQHHTAEPISQQMAGGRTRYRGSSSGGDIGQQLATMMD
jgi:hypothetical protein